MQRSAFRLAAVALPIIVAAALASAVGRVQAADQAAGPHVHAWSLIGEPKTPPEYKHFSWVRPDAPKGGLVRLRAIGTFDSLNRFAFKAIPAAGLAVVHATLMARAFDEPSTQYGYLAEWASHPADYSSASFGLRPEARFSDGSPVTPEDVVFTLSALKQANPRYAFYFKNVVKAEKVGPREVRFVFDTPGNRELPVIVGELPILPRHVWQAKDTKGEQRDLARGTIELPVGAGPYRVGAFEVGRRVSYERIADWWAKDLAIGRGQYNFDRVTYIYYRDRLPAFEDFKAGGTDFWLENSAKGWATDFGFDAVKRGLVKREEIPDTDIKSMQGFVFNLRRARFQDRRVRQAFNLAFNFEWANKAMFFDQYRRSSSYFGNSELACRGLPEGAERDILDQQRSLLPAEVFKAQFRNPENRQPGDFRRHMGEASRLLSDAGWTIRDGVRTNAAGEPMTVEVLLVQPSFERLVLAYKAELGKLGIRADVRVVDAAQYRRRLQAFDFDMVVASFPQSNSPGNEQREYWGSKAADQHGSRNLIGIKSPAIDALVERLIYASNRADLVAATRALDRALLWGHYVVPQFHAPVDRVAFWSKFGRPERHPAYASPDEAFIRIWWYDDKAAARLERDRKG